MQRPINALLILLFISILALFAFWGSQVGEATNPASVLLASTPTPTLRRGTPPKATPSPRAKPTSTPITQPKRVGTTRSPSAPTAFWTQITSEGFEVCSMPCPGWSVVDLSNDGFERYWKDARYWDGTAYRANSGSWAAWPARGGADGYDPSSNNNYTNTMDTRMIYGPFDLSDAGDAQVYFYLWREIEPGFDYLTFEVSLDGVNFQELARWDGFVQTWELESISLRNYTGYSQPVGNGRVWVAWRFFSDYSVTYQGPWVDDISIFKLVPGQVTAQGWVNYYDRNDARSAVPFATVHLFDHNTNGNDFELATIYTDQYGFFQVTTRNWEYWDGGDPDHTLDLYIVVEAFYYDSGTTFHRVTDIGGSTYKWPRPPTWIIHMNVPDGTVDLSYDVPINDTNRPAMWLFSDLRRAWAYVVSYGYSDPGSVTVTWQAGSECYPFEPGICDSFFYAPGQFIFIKDSAIISSDTVIHETGHKYMFNATNWWWWRSTCWGHDIFRPMEENCGWSEGWGDFFALVVNGDQCYDKRRGPCTGVQNRDFYDLENQSRNDGQATGDTVEGRVAGALYDLFDITNEGYDQVQFGFYPIWNIIRTAPTETRFRDFSNSWIASGYDLRTSLLAFYQNTIDYLSTNYLPIILK